MDAKNEVVDNKHERVDNYVLYPERKGYCLRKPPTINYNDGRYNWHSMDWRKLVVGSHDLHNVVKAYTNAVNTITTFVEPTPPNNLITH